MSQHHSSPSGRENREETPGEDPGAEATPTAGSGNAQSSTDNLDSLLDEIDTVLESNAEEFVKGFVQKGGQ
ncbi:ubiquitin-like protein Pup [Citricoccus sp. GCM10030269]|uniref:ubiquitin-like protein Pup n=1 Tax=Citricoccus sp. GCM10030269 TaxID=3273388 RepID=UPI003606313A